MLKNETVNVVCVEDCGNAPKKQLLKEFNIALAMNNQEYILENVTDDIHWNIIGKRLIEGKENIMEVMNLLSQNVKEIQISTIITHGKTGSTNGVLIFTDNQKYGFSNVFIFNSSRNTAKVKEMSSYIIKV